MPNFSALEQSITDYFERYAAENHCEKDSTYDTKLAQTIQKRNVAGPAVLASRRAFQTSRGETSPNKPLKPKVSGLKTNRNKAATTPTLIIYTRTRFFILAFHYRQPQSKGLTFV